MSTRATRVRKPSSRALSAAESYLATATPPQAEPAAPAPTTTTASRSRRSTGKGKQPAVPQPEPEEPIPEEQESSQSQPAPPTAGEPDFTLYCICLGFATDEPMIQCEYCSNWFHFRCIGLDEHQASQIEEYCCDICQEMGVGVTKRIDETSQHTRASTPADDDDDVDDPQDEDVVMADSPSDHGSDDEEYTEEDGTRSSAKRAKATDGARRVRRKVGSEPVDAEYTGDAEASLKDTKSRKKGTPQPRASTSKRGQRQGSFLDDSDGEGTPGKARARGPRKPSASAAPPPPVDIANAPSAPPSDKTRSHCVKQLTTIFNSIFSASEADSNSIGIEVRAAAFAESVEAELFEGFSELDPKGIRSPRAKYVAKFRSLHFNLKTNAVFRSRISANVLAPSQIVNMSNEDLLTPELRAMADSVRAASLKHSVKEVISAPTAKRTHKGEEEIDNSLAATVAADDDKMLLDHEKRIDNRRERSDSNPQMSPAPSQSPRNESTRFFGSPPPTTSAQYPSSLDSTNSTPLPSFPSSSSRPRSSLPTSTLAISADELGLEVDEQSTPGPAVPRSRSVSANNSPFPRSSATSNSPAPKLERTDSDESAMLPPPPPPPPIRARSSFDMASVWGKVKASPKVESGETMEGTPGMDGKDDGEEEEDDYDPLALMVERNDDDDEFEAALLRGEDPSKLSSTPKVPKAVKPNVTDLPHVWSGNFIVPDEGGFPSFAVQVGGRHLGIEPSTWSQLLPRGLTTDGRIPTPTATKYLLECSFAPSRELIIVALVPDLTGPTDSAQYKPSKESCLIKHRHVIDFYVKRDRIGVVAPSGDLKKVVKDIYITPLRKNEPLPEYMELLDSHLLPEGPRKEDMMLCVLVVQKGAMPTVKQASLPPTTVVAPASVPIRSTTPPLPPPPPATTTSAPAPVVPLHSSLPSRPPPQAQPLPPPSFSPRPDIAPPSNSQPSYIPPTPAPIAVAAAASPPLPNLDPAALQSILSSLDPSNLSSLLASITPAAGAAPPPPPQAAAPYAPPPHLNYNAPPPPPQAQGGYYDQQQRYDAPPHGGYGGGGDYGYGAPQRGGYESSYQGQQQGYGSGSPYGGGNGGGMSPYGGGGGSRGGGMSPYGGGAGGRDDRAGSSEPGPGKVAVHPSRLALLQQGPPDDYSAPSNSGGYGGGPASYERPTGGRGGYGQQGQQDFGPRGGGWGGRGGRRG